jgi:hypothetical protein
MNKKKDFNKPSTGRKPKPNPKNNQGRKDCEEQTYKPREYNDASWYAKSPQSLKDAASFSFNNPLGNAISMRLGEHVSGVSATSVPGIATVRLAHSLGASSDATSPINVAAKNIYSFVRHANSGHANYEAPDMMCYIAATADAYSMYAWMVRLYGVLNTYSQTNRYYPTALVRAMNVDFTDLMQHINDFRGYINRCALKLSVLWIPSDLPIFKRRYWVYSNIYTDASTGKAQTYLFNPAYFYKFDPTGPTGSRLVPVHIDFAGAPTYLGQPAEGIGYKPISFEDIRTIFDSLVDPMLADEDIGIMSGDIKKAYGDRLLGVSQIDASYTVLPVYNEEVLSQIHHIKTARLFAENPVISQDDKGNIVETKECIVGQFADTSNAVAKTHDVYLNSRHNTVEPEEVMVSTRLMWASLSKPRTFNYQATPYTAVKIDTCGCEVPLTIRIWQVAPSNRSGWGFYHAEEVDGRWYINKDIATDVYVDAGVWYAEGIQKGWDTIALSEVSNFDWFPLLYIVSDQDDVAVGGNYKPFWTIGDLNNYRSITPYELSNINQTAWLSLLNVPQG